MLNNTIEILIALLIAAAVLAWLANRVRLPYPILLTLGGLAIGFVPWERWTDQPVIISLPPELVFLLFLPPLLFHAGMMTSWRDFIANVRPIMWLAVGLVAVTIVVVAWVAHATMGFGWPAAFALGAIVSPTDTIAATAVATRLRVPKRIVTIIEGESLINDATALVAYRLAVVAAGATTFALGTAALSLVWVAVGGVAIGLLAGLVVIKVRQRLRDPSIEGAISLLSPFIAYLPAQWIGVSGVLAAVTAGIYVARQTSRLLSARSRLRGFAVWDALVFMLNVFLFIIMGLQLPGILTALRGYGAAQLCWYAVLVSLVVILIRIAWVFPATYVPRWVSMSFARRDPAPPWKETAIVAWTGMRGIVSLAAALALPEGFEYRDLIIFLTFCVILATLIVQGLSLPLLIIAFRFKEEDEETQEELTARHATAVAALERLAQMQQASNAPPDLVERMRVNYDDRVRYLVGRLMGEDTADGPPAYDTLSQLHRELLAVERQALVLLRDQNVIGDEVMRKVELDLDLEEYRLKAVTDE
jgi:Na+/H+ antiporter